MKVVTATIAIAVALLFMAGASPGQDQRRPTMGPMMMMGQYDAKTEITLQGIVEQADRLGFGYGNMHGTGGVHLVLRSANETIDVHLGPADFVEKTMSFKEGDKIEVVGSKVTMMGRTAFVAREVRKDGQVLKLRDERGLALWSGMPGMRRQCSLWSHLTIYHAAQI